MRKVLKKENILEFAEWCALGYDYKKHGDDFAWFYKFHDNPIPKTTEELFDLYKFDINL